tara:strand:+ start:117 stop:770 length:654 start_codon:yes stop_codon:yes gene_type:complete
MAVPTGTAKFSEIQTEFGGSNPISLSEYYSGGSNTKSNLGIFAPNGIPTSGTISVNDFRGAENTSEEFSTNVTFTAGSIAFSNPFLESKGRSSLNSPNGSIADDTPDNGRMMKSSTLNEVTYNKSTPKGSSTSTEFFKVQIFISNTVSGYNNNINNDTDAFKQFRDTSSGGGGTFNRSAASYTTSVTGGVAVHSWQWGSTPYSPIGTGTRSVTFDCD